MLYEAVIFDLDGTLIDSLDDLADSANEMLESYGYPIHAVEKYRIMVGNGSKKLMQRCLPEGLDDQQIESALAKYKNIYERRFLEKTRSYEGILTLLHELKIKNIPLAVCTNKHSEAAHTLVEVLFEENTFIEVVGDTNGMLKKPDPANVLAIAKRMGICPERVAYLGDSMVDMQTAVNAHMLPVGVLWGFREEKELLDNGAKVILHHPAELFEKVKFIEAE